MSRIWGIIVGVCAVVGVGAIVFTFSGARGKVAKDKLLDSIDSMIGKDEIKRKEIAEGIEGYQKAVKTLNRAKITAQVQAEQVQAEVKTQKKKIEESKDALTKLKGDLKKFETESSYSVSYGGKTYNKAEDLDKMARVVVEHHKTLIAQTEVLEKRLENYNQIAATMTTRADEAKKKLQELEDNLKDIDAQMAQAKAYRDAAAALHESDKTFGDSVQDLEKKMKDLSASTKASVRIEEEDMKALTTKTEVEDASKIINNTKSTASEIDALLGNK